MEAVRTCETSIYFNETAGRYIQEGSNLQERTTALHKNGEGNERSLCMQVRRNAWRPTPHLCMFIVNSATDKQQHV
jgi:hypothetical protein